jgi:hypothetical protein
MSLDPIPFTFGQDVRHDFAKVAVYFIGTGDFLQEGRGIYRPYVAPWVALASLSSKAPWMASGSVPFLPFHLEHKDEAPLGLERAAEALEQLRLGHVIVLHDQ